MRNGAGVSTFAALKTRIFAQPLSADGLRLEGERLVVLENDQPWEAHLLPRCDGTRTVRQLIQLSGKSENEALASLVAMSALRVLDAK